MRFLLAFVLAILVSSPARAEEPTPSWPAGTPRKVADWTSTAIVAAQIGIDLTQAFRQEDRWPSVRRESIRIGVAVVASEVVKHFVHRERPNGYDDKSFWSEHTAVTWAASGWSFSASMPLELAVPYLRMAADWHHPSDVVVGAVVGGLTHFIK